MNYSVLIYTLKNIMNKFLIILGLVSIGIILFIILKKKKIITTTLSPTTTYEPKTTLLPTTTEMLTTTSSPIVVSVRVVNDSLDVPITGVWINSVAVTYVNGINFPVNSGDVGYFETTQEGPSKIDVYYGGHVPGQKIVVDSGEIFCYNLNGNVGNTSDIFSLNIGVGVNINVSDGTC